MIHGPSRLIRFLGATTAAAVLALAIAPPSQAQSAPGPAVGGSISAQLPTMGDGSDLTASAERRLGDRIAREIYRDPDYIDDPVLGDYVDGI